MYFFLFLKPNDVKICLNLVNIFYFYNFLLAKQIRFKLFYFTPFKSDQPQITWMFLQVCVSLLCNGLQIEIKCMDTTFRLNAINLSCRSSNRFALELLCNKRNERSRKASHQDFPSRVQNSAVGSS